MILNETAYVHKKIRTLCGQLEVLTKTKMITDLSAEFKEIQFIDRLGYIIIDYEKETIFTLANKLDPVEFEIVKDIMLYCNWLEICKKYEKKPCNKNVTFIFQKTFDNQKQNVYTRKCKEDKKSSIKLSQKELHKM